MNCQSAAVCKLCELMPDSKERLRQVVKEFARVYNMMK